MNSVIRIFLVISLMPLGWLMAEDLKVKVSEQTFTKPAAKSEKTASKMRAAQFSVPGKAGEELLNAYSLFCPGAGRGAGEFAALGWAVCRDPSRNLRWMTLR